MYRSTSCRTPPYEVYFQTETDIISFSTGQKAATTYVSHDSDVITKTTTPPFSMHVHPKGMNVYNKTVEYSTEQVVLAISDRFRAKLAEQQALPSLHGAHCELVSPQISALCDIMLCLRHQPEWRNQCVLESVAVLAYTIVAGIERHDPDYLPSYKHLCLGKASRFAQVVDYIEAHLSDDISLQTLADIASVSLFHFSRLFKQVMSRSPHQFILERRLQRAKLLLEAGDMPIAAIAVTTGFVSQSHLGRTFKARFGLTPYQHRKQVRS